MPVTLGEAILYLRSKDDGLTQGLDDAGRKTESWASGLGGKIGPLIGGAVVAGTAAAGAAIVGIGAKAFSVADEVRNATLSMQGDFGLTADEAKRLADVGVAVFGNNFAGSITEAADAVALVRQQLGNLDDADLQDATENAFRLRDAWGVDVAEGLDAARTLMDNFGLSQQEAFDTLASGFQRGLNRSDDFLDTVNEYSVQFANAGASSAEFFGLLESGLAGGNLGTDKAADLFKEFFIRIQDGSDTTAAALNNIGINSEDLLGRISSGATSGADAFNEVITALYAIEDPLTLSQNGVALLGTQFEDIGQSLGSLDLIPDAFENVTGAIDSVDARYQSFGAMWEGLTRQFTVALAPLGDELLSIANDAMPYVQQAFAWMTDNLPGIISGAVDIVRGGVDWIKRLFSGDLAEGLNTGLGRFQFVKDWIDENMPLIRQTVQTVLNAITAFWQENGETIMRIVIRTFSAISSTIESVMRIILGVIRAAMLLINGDWTGAWEELKNVVGIYLDAMKTLLGTAVGNFVDIVGAIGPRLYSAGQALVDNLWGGLKAKWENVKSWWTEKTGWVANMLPGSEPKDPSSPLRNLSARGEAIIDNLQAGLDRASLNLTGAIPGLGAQPEPIIVYQTINANGPADASMMRQSSRDGLLDAQRKRGV